LKGIYKTHSKVISHCNKKTIMNLKFMIVLHLLSVV